MKEKACFSTTVRGHCPLALAVRWVLIASIGLFITILWICIRLAETFVISTVFRVGSAITNRVFWVHFAVLFVGHAVLWIHFTVKLKVTKLRKLLAILFAVTAFRIHLAILVPSNFYVTWCGLTFTGGLARIWVHADPLVITTKIFRVFTGGRTTIAAVPATSFIVVVEVAPAVGYPGFLAPGL